MAWGLFHQDFNYDRRPAQAIAFAIKASEQPQQWPRDVIEAAVVAGKATAVKAPSRRKSRH